MVRFPSGRPAAPNQGCTQTERWEADLAAQGDGRRLRSVRAGTGDVHGRDQVSGSLPHGRGGGSGPEAADALLRRVARGDDAAFGQLYDLLAAATYGLALSVLRDPSQAREVTQEVFLQVWQNASRFDPTLGSAKAWVVTMAQRRAVERVRSAQASVDRDVEVGVRTVTPDPTAGTAAVRFEQQRVRRCLDGLTELQRHAVTLAFYRGYTHREVGELLSVPLGTTTARLRDGLLQLRDCLGVA